MPPIVDPSVRLATAAVTGQFDDDNEEDEAVSHPNDISSLVASFHDELPIPNILDVDDVDTQPQPQQQQQQQQPQVQKQMASKNKNGKTSGNDDIADNDTMMDADDDLNDEKGNDKPKIHKKQDNTTVTMKTSKSSRNSTSNTPKNTAKKSRKKSLKSEDDTSSNNNTPKTKKSRVFDREKVILNAESNEAQRRMEIAEREWKVTQENVKNLTLELEMLQRKVQQAKTIAKRRQEEYREALTYYKDVDITNGSSCQWNDMFQKLKDYKGKHGHTLVPHKDKEDKDLNRLGRWVANQRVFYKMHCDGKLGHIKPHRIEALNDIGFCWNKYEYLWNRRYEELKDYYQTYGHTRVPKHCATHSQELCEWCIVQIREYKAHCDGCPTTMNETRISKLNDLGFTWQTPPTFSEKIPYRYQKKRAREVLERKRKLEEEGLATHNRRQIEQQWNSGYQELVEYYKKYGDCKVNREEGREINIKLRRFVSWIRFEYKRFMDLQHQLNSDDDDDDDNGHDNDEFDDEMIEDVDTGGEGKKKKKKKKDKKSKNTARNRPIVITWERIKLLQDLDFPWGHGNDQGRVRNPRTLKAKAEAEGRMKHYVFSDFMEDNSQEQQHQTEGNNNLKLEDEMDRNGMAGQSETDDSEYHHNRNHEQAYQRLRMLGTEGVPM